MVYKILWLLFFMTSLVYSTEKSFEKVIKNLNENSAFQRLSIGICIGNSDQTFAKYNEKKLLRPVSSIKLLSTALAYEFLNPEKPFVTKLGHTGEIENQVLKGDLIIKGQSDPTFGSDRFGGMEKVLNELCKTLEYLSVKKIEGDLIVDSSAFEKALSPPSWAFEDLGNYYGVGASSLNFHENFYAISYRLGKKVGDEARVIRITPKVKGLKLSSHVITREKGSGDQAYIFGKEYSNEHVVHGSLPLGQSTFKIRGSLPNPSLFCANMLGDYLKKQGIKIVGKVLVNYEKKDQSPTWIYSNRSPDLQRIASLTHKHSINLYSEALLKRVALEKFGRGSTENGLIAFSNFLKNMNVPQDDFSLYDASGLSHKNLVTPFGFVAALEGLKKKEYFVDYLKSIAKASSYNAFSDLEDSIKDKIYIKSGSSSQFLCFAGYIESKSCGLLSYSFMCNNCEKNRSEFYSLVKQFLQVAAEL